MNIWKLFLQEEWGTLFDLGFYGIFSADVNAVPKEPEAGVRARAYDLSGRDGEYYRKRERSHPWDSNHDVEIGRDLKLV
jgi:hypothetical protein